MLLHTGSNVLSCCLLTKSRGASAWEESRAVSGSHAHVVSQSTYIIHAYRWAAVADIRPRFYVYAGVHNCVHVCEGQRRTFRSSSVAVHALPLKQCLSLNLEPNSFDKTVGHQAPAVLGTGVRDACFGKQDPTPPPAPVIN